MIDQLLAELGIKERYTKEPQDYIKKQSSEIKSKVIEIQPRSPEIPNEIKSERLESAEVLARKARSLAESCASLEELKKAVSHFKDLSICKLAQNTVFSDGNPTGKIMVIGEAPGASEDEEGIPFCGMSGKLLDKMFESVGLSRESNLYITNSIFWRPPGNRRPTPEETNVCLPFIEKHIALFKPGLIILVGSTAAISLLNSLDSISKLRQKFHTYNNRYLSQEVPVAAIFHPSYLLRQPKQKKVTWYDLLKIQDRFGDLIK